MKVNNNQNIKRIKDLGIFYTPQVVVDFIFNILEIWKKKQINRWKTKEGKKKYPSVIDPSVGEGIFLKTAVAKNFTKPEWIFGLDIDESVVKKWKEINLLKEFGGIDEDLEAHFFHQNGLEKIKWNQHKNKYRYKLKQIDIKNQQFDVIVGNPPYGGVGLGQSKLKDELIEQLSYFEIFPRSVRNVLNNANIQTDFFNSDKSFSLNNKVKQKIRSFPIEILFLERFTQLAKPGGWIAVIIPDGILTNSNAEYVRDFISKRTKIEAIISLPRNTFKSVGTNAKTSVLFLRKLKESEKPEKDYSIFLSSIEEINEKYFNYILSIYKNFYNGEFEMDKNKLIQITKDQNGKEAVMVRVDKTLREMMEEKPFSRFDVNYWHPKWDEIIRELESSVIDTKFLKDFSLNNEWLISTDHVRASKGEKEETNLPVEYYSPAGFLFTGYNTSEIPRCSENAYQRMRRARPIKKDLLLGGFGMGPTGKSLVLWHVPSEKAIVGNIFILRVKSFYNPFVLDVFFKTVFGQAQFNKYKTGVAFNSLSNDEIKYLLVPIFPDIIVNEINSSYKNVILSHNKAMEAKKSGNTIEYKKNIETAEKKLKKLISDTEAIIRGEKENIR